MGSLAIASLVMGIIAAAAGIGGGIASGVKANKASEKVKEEQGIIAKNHANQEALFNREYYQNINDAVDVQNAMRMLNDSVDTDSST